MSVNKGHDWTCQIYEHYICSQCLFQISDLQMKLKMKFWNR